ARSAVASFNIITLEHIEAVIAGAESVNAPVVLQVSENAVRFRYGRLLPLARAAVTAAERAAVPVALHLDHVQSDALLRQAPDAGFGSVMYDAARLPYAEHLADTRGPVAPPTPGCPRRRTSRPPGSASTGPTPGGCGSRPNWATSGARTAGARWTPTRPAPAPPPTRPAPSSPTPAWTPWPSRSAPPM